MATGAGPNVANTGLVFEYDMGNTKESWMGRPTVNLISNAGANAEIERSADGLVYGYFAADITSYVQANWTPSNNKFSMSFEGKRDYSVGGTGGGGDGYPSMYIYFGDWSWSSSFGISTYEWSYNQLNDITMPDPTGKYVGFSIYHMNAGNPGRSYSRKHQVEFGTYATPFVNGTRTSSQSIIDMTQNSTTTIIDAIYESTGLLKFDGVNDYVAINNFTSQPTTAITCEAWIKPTRSSVGTGTIRGGAISSSNTMYLGIIDSTDGGNTFSMHWANQTSSSRLYNWNGSIPNNAWSCLTGTYDGTTSRAYLNGVEIWSTPQTGTIPSGNYVLGTYGPAGNLQDGSHNFNGYLGNARIYDRALSAAEVQQNFNALRSRFGI